MNKTHTPDCDRSVASAPDRAEELARKIVELVNDENGTGWDERFDNRIIAAVASLLRREMRWIPVSEKVPDANGTGVLISYGSGPWVGEAIFEWGFDSKPAWAFVGTGAGFAWGVTHWQPLPAPPSLRLQRKGPSAKAEGEHEHNE